MKLALRRPYPLRAGLWRTGAWPRNQWDSVQRNRGEWGPSETLWPRQRDRPSASMPALEDM